MNETFYIYAALAASAEEGAEARFRLARRKALADVGRPKNCWLILLCENVSGFTFVELEALAPNTPEGNEALFGWELAIQASRYILDDERGFYVS